MPKVSSASASPPLWQPWLALGLFAFLLHFVWELLQTPFYAQMGEARHWAAVLRCTRATGGDVLITWAAYGVAAAWVPSRLWLAGPRRRAGLAVYLLTGLAITVALERLNVYVWRSWAYSGEMPVVLGIGLTPVLQWLLVPPLTLWLARRHLGLSSEEIQ